MSRACDSIACGTCPKPGRCCAGFQLNSALLEEAAAPTALHAMTRLASMPQLMVDGTIAPLPFHPLFIAQDGQWRWWCDQLQADGRCGAYDRRPWLCAHYAPASCRLCVIHPGQS